jgi:hypothetical protein
MAHHLLVLITRPPEKLELRYEGVKRDKPPPPGYISIVPSACVAQWRWTGPKDSLHIFLDPELIARVASESFELDSARTEIPPFDGLKVPEIRAAMLAVNAELTTGGIGGPILVEVIINIVFNRCDFWSVAATRGLQKCSPDDLVAYLSTATPIDIFAWHVEKVARRLESSQFLPSDGFR